jgi:hypothetical protein
LLLPLLLPLPLLLLPVLLLQSQGCCTGGPHCLPLLHVLLHH